MVSCGGYKPGLGPFHAQSFESMLAHTPGIDVVMPSSAGDAAGLLNAAFESRRPTVFLYPKAVLNNSDGRTSTDLDKHFVRPGLSRYAARGRDLTLVTYGNTVSLVAKAASAFEAQWDFPWRSSTCARSRPGTKRKCSRAPSAPSA